MAEEKSIVEVTADLIHSGELTYDRFVELVGNDVVVKALLVARERGDLPENMTREQFLMLVVVALLEQKRLLLEVQNASNLLQAIKRYGDSAST